MIWAYLAKTIWPIKTKKTQKELGFQFDIEKAEKNKSTEKNVLSKRKCVTDVNIAKQIEKNAMTNGKDDCKICIERSIFF